MENQENKQNILLKKKLFGRISYLTIIGLIVGAIGGYIYYLQVGCVSGTCAITSNPWMSTALGGTFGYLVFGIFDKKRTKED